MIVGGGHYTATWWPMLRSENDEYGWIAGDVVGEQLGVLACVLPDFNRQSWF